jgi:hypothetical protein
VDPVAPVLPVDPVSPVDPVDPVAPVGPAGPGTGTGTATTGAGVTTVAGLSHALNASAITTAENIIEYFMRIPFDCLTKTAHLDRFAATPSYTQKIRHIHMRFRSLAHITPLLLGPIQPVDGSIPAQIRIFVSYVRCRTELPKRTGNNLPLHAASLLLLPEGDARVKALG